MHQPINILEYCVTIYSRNEYSQIACVPVPSPQGATFVAALSFANMSGRFGWATASDYLGRKNTYYVMGMG